MMRDPMTSDEILAATESKLRTRLQILHHRALLSIPGADDEANLIRAELAKRQGEGIEQ